jgi:hypothetical protein
MDILEFMYEYVLIIEFLNDVSIAYCIVYSNCTIDVQ